MHTLKLSSALLFLTIVATSCDSGRPVSDVFTGTVTKVHDGDSVHIKPRGQKRVIVRLAAIDAPEVKQAHGISSRDHLRHLIMNKKVTARCNKRDKYQRQVCVVLLNGEDTNIAMLKSGHAWYYEQFKEEQSSSDQRAYKKAEKSAQRQNLGLWKNTSAVPPWKYRASNRN